MRAIWVIKVLLLALFATALSLDAFAQVDRNHILTPEGRPSLILLRIMGQTSTGERSMELGTGFFITSTGYALTAAHLFYRKSAIDDAAQRIQEDDQDDYIDGRLGSAGEPYKRFQLVRIYTDLDVALIQLYDPLKPVPFIAVCSDPPPSDDPLTIYGFSGAQVLVHTEGHIQGNLIGTRYPVDITINPAQSGSPIVTVSGKVYGIALGGVRQPQFQNYNFILAAQFLSQILGDARTKEDCSQRNELRTKQVTASSRLRPALLFGQGTTIYNGFSYFNQSGFTFSTHSIVAWNDPRSDIGAALAAPGAMDLFLPFEADPYRDPGARAGIAPAPLQSLGSTDDCNNVSQYAYHWFTPFVNGIYCIRTRSGGTFAKIFVRVLSPVGVTFDWIYQPAG